MLHSQKTREINRVEKMHPSGDGDTKKLQYSNASREKRQCIKTFQKVNPPMFFMKALWHS